MSDDRKTKRVSGVQLEASSFAFVGDPDDTNTWKLPIYFRGDTAKTVSHIINALARFDQAKIPDNERPSVWHFIRGAASAHGIAAEQRTFETKKAVAVEVAETNQEPATVVVVSVTPERDLDEFAAMADRKATAFLRGLGLE